MQQNNATNNGNAQQGTTQTDNNSFMIEPEPQTDQLLRKTHRDLK